MDYDENFIMSPKVDFAFKEIMRNNKVCKGFLSAVLGIKDTNIKSIVMLNTNLSKVHEDEKQGILDVRLTMNNNTEIDIEIQVWYMKQWANRSVFYVSKMISEQPDINKKYSNMKKCINISILNFTYIKQTDRFYTSYHIREDKEHFKYTDIAEWHVVELPKLPEVPDGTAIYDWAKFINSEDRGEFEMLAKKNEYIAEAYKQLDIISQDQQKRLEYMARQKALYDYNELVYENYNDGYEKGKNEGVYEEKVRTAEKMLKRGVMTIDEISEDTGLSVAEIENIKANIT